MSNARWLKAAFEDNGQVEVRGLLLNPVGNRHTWTGLYDNADALVRDVRAANRSGEFKGLYALLNRPFKRQPTNRMTPAIYTTRDRDIERITRLVFDFDPVRSEPNSDDEELEEAKSKACKLAEFLLARGWPEPLYAMSGNGWHLQWRVDMPADKQTRDTLAPIYRGLKLRFDTPEVAFDTAVRNPSRIFRLYGTKARKGVDEPHRPRRVTQCWTPEKWERVDLELIEMLADEVKPAKPKLLRTTGSSSAPPSSGRRGDYRTLDVVGWFASNGHYLRDLGEGKHAVVCPWSNEHSEDGNGTDTVVWEASGGWPAFRCLHAHCDDRRIGDVMAFFRDADRFCQKAFAADGVRPSVVNGEKT